MSARFETLKARYERGGCTITQLMRFVQLGALTAEEFKAITGQDYKER